MKIRSVALTLLIAMVALALTGCDGLGAARRDPLANSSWTLVAYRKSRPIPGTTITATFAQGQIRGSAGCNSYACSYTLNEGNLSVGEIEVTEMGCLEPAGILDQEQAYLALLAQTQTYHIDDQGRLILSAGHESITFAPRE